MTNPLVAAEKAIEKTVVGWAKSVGEKLGLNVESGGQVFITGGTGPIGHRIALRLAEAGHPHVRVGVHNTQACEDLSNFLGVEVVRFDWKNAESYPSALQGVKSVMITAPYILNWQEQFPAFLKACQDAGVKHIVKLSFFHARTSGEMFQDVPLIRAHGDCDEMLSKSGIDYTIIAATHFMSNPFVFQGDNLRSDLKPAPFYGSSADKGVNYVSPNDVAEVAVHALMEPKAHINKEYSITGPEAIKDQAVASLLSDYLEKPIMYVDQPPHTFEDTEKVAGDPEWLVTDLVALEKIKSSGTEEDIAFTSLDFGSICGHEGEKFSDYLAHTRTMTSIEKA
jgi:uncharacterized protein YbjT (DUF2867 family)